MSNVKLGRKVGTKNMPKVKPNLGIKNIRLDAKHPFPEQLRAFRELLGIPQAEMASRLGLAPSNLQHFEKQNSTNGKNPFASTKNNISETALKYAKALGAAKIEILL